MSMFCFQCQEAAGGTGCTVKGVCGKTDVVAAEQDLLIYAVKGVAWAAETAGRYNVTVDDEVGRFIMYGLFTTITHAGGFAVLITQEKRIRNVTGIGVGSSNFVDGVVGISVGTHRGSRADKASAPDYKFGVTIAGGFADCFT